MQSSKDSGGPTYEEQRAWQRTVHHHDHGWVYETEEGVHILDLERKRQFLKNASVSRTTWCSLLLPDIWNDITFNTNEKRRSFKYSTHNDILGKMQYNFNVLMMKEIWLESDFDRTVISLLS